MAEGDTACLTGDAGVTQGYFQELSARVLWEGLAVRGGIWGRPCPQNGILKPLALQALSSSKHYPSCAEMKATFAERRKPASLRLEIRSIVSRDHFVNYARNETFMWASGGSRIAPVGIRIAWLSSFSWLDIICRTGWTCFLNLIAEYVLSRLCRKHRCDSLG